MKSQVNFVYDFDNDPADELKHWLFLESVRLKDEKQEIEDEKRILENEKIEFDKIKKEQLAIIASKEKRLAKEKELFNSQWKLLESELKRVTRDDDRIKKEREYLEIEKRNFRKALNKDFAAKRKAESAGNSGTDEYGKSSGTGHTSYSTGGMTVISSFFTGTNGMSSVKKRYRDLTKIFHPDNMGGDTDVLLQINKEYEEIKRRYTD